MQWWFKKFSKGDESPEDEKNCGQPLEGDNDQLRGLSKYLTATQEVSQELCQPFYGCLAFEANWKGEKTQ